LPAISVSGAP